MRLVIKEKRVCLRERRRGMPARDKERLKVTVIESCDAKKKTVCRYN